MGAARRTRSVAVLAGVLGLMLPASGSTQEIWIPGDSVSTGGALGFGESVSLDGNTLIVGAPRSVAGGFDGGAAFVYVCTDGVWTFRARLTPSDPADRDGFGSAVAIHDDTIVVASPGEPDRSEFPRGAYVFIRTGDTWTQQAKLLASDGAKGDQFGSAVAIDGDTVVVGARFKNGAGLLNGAAYVFTRTGDVWTEQAKLTASDSATADAFGHSVAVSGDTALIGAPFRDDAGASSGVVYEFGRAEGVWTELEKIAPPEASAGDEFGSDLALQGDTALVGAPGDDDLGTDSGAAHVFTRTAGAWSPEAKLVAPDREADDLFGETVALDGDAAAVGAASGVGNRGAAYLFSRAEGPWAWTGKVRAAELEPGDEYADLALDGAAAVAGVPKFDFSRGAAHVFPTVASVGRIPPLVAGLGRPFRAVLPPTGGVPPFQWALAGGALPEGVALEPGSGALSGTPLVEGRFDASVTVTDGRGAVSAEAGLSLDVVPLLDLSAGESLGTSSGRVYRALELCQGTRLTVEARFLPGALGPGDLRLLDPKGAPLDLSDRLRARERSLLVRRFLVPATGRYFLDVAAPGAIGGEVALRVAAKAPRRVSGTARPATPTFPQTATFSSLPGATMTFRVRAYHPREGDYTIEWIRDSEGNPLDVEGLQEDVRGGSVLRVTGPLPGGDLTVGFAFRSKGSSLLVIQGYIPPPCCDGRWVARIREPLGYGFSLPEEPSGTE